MVEVSQDKIDEIEEPTKEELDYIASRGNHQVGCRLTCPDCGGSDTEFIRNSYWICHGCIIWFTVQDTK